MKLPPQDTATVVITAPESLDIYAAAGLRDELREVIDQPGTAAIVVDLDRTIYLDMAGLGILAAACHHATIRRRRFAVVRAREPVLRKFRTTGLNRVVNVHGTARDRSSDADD